MTHYIASHNARGLDRSKRFPAVSVGTYSRVVYDVYPHLTLDRETLRYLVGGTQDLKLFNRFKQHPTQTTFDVPTYVSKTPSYF